MPDTPFIVRSGELGLTFLQADRVWRWLREARRFNARDCTCFVVDAVGRKAAKSPVEAYRLADNLLRQLKRDGKVRWDESAREWEVTP
jgi:hypothetical protein